VIDPLDGEMKDRFEQTWATLVSKKNPKGLFASPTTSSRGRDSSAVWLSSGNWRRRTSPTCILRAQSEDLPAGFQRKYNRDYHAIIKNDKLAAIYESYIKRDFEQSAAQADQAVSSRSRISRPSRTFSCRSNGRTCRLREGSASVRAAAFEPAR